MVDGALMLRAYAAWGMACVERVLGDFAFAVWDTKNRRLFAATDRFSIRPVYYAQTAQGVLVGNSIGTMLQSGWVGTALDESAIADFLALGLKFLFCLSTLGVGRIKPRARLYHFALGAGRSQDRCAEWGIGGGAAPLALCVSSFGG